MQGANAAAAQLASPGSAIRGVALTSTGNIVYTGTLVSNTSAHGLALTPDGPNSILLVSLGSGP